MEDFSTVAEHWNADESLIECRSPERDIRYAQTVVDVEVPLDRRTPQIEVDQRHAATCPRKSNGEIRDRRRLSLAARGARDQDRRSTPVDVHELEVGGEDAEGLRFRRVRARQHRQAVLS